MIVACVLSGDGMMQDGKGRRTDVWINANDQYTENLVYQVWDEVRSNRKKFRIPFALTIEEEPHPVEAREVGRIMLSVMIVGIAN